MRTEVDDGDDGDGDDDGQRWTTMETATTMDEDERRRWTRTMIN
jgi:hypothetical protein